jgi:predicted phage tail protein
MSVIEKGKVTFLYIANPLTPAESRNLVEREYKPRKSLAKYLGPLDGEWAVSVSGRMVHKSEWSKTYLTERDCVVIAPILLGGGGESSGKTIMRLVAMIAIAIFAPYAGAALFGAGTVGAAVVTAGVMIGGTMLVNAILPPPKPQMPGSGSGFNSSPTYGIDGPKNLSTKNVPVPVVYGESWFAGNFVQTYVENSDDTQYLHMLLNVGEGPIEDITDIHVNDQPLSNFSEIEIFKRFGAKDQEVIPYFNDIIKPINRNVNLKSGVWTLHTITDPVDRLRIDIVLPKGLSYLDDEDGMRGTSTAFRAEIREQGTSAWLPFNGSSSEIRIEGKSMSPMRKSYYSTTLNKSKRYEIRLTHTEDDESEKTANSITLTDVNEILFDDIQYRYTALLGLRIKLSDQLNGIPKVTYRVKGRKVRVWDAATGNYVERWTDNPAWIVVDAMTNTRYGGGIRMERIKLSYFRQWAEYCEANGLKFNGVIDQKTNLWDALLPIFKAGRGMPVRSGTKFQVSIVGKRKPVQLFTMSSVKKDSMNIDWLPADERANEVTVTYFDRNDFGKQKTVTVHSPRARARGDHPKPTEMTLYGVDNLEQATREATLAMNMNVLLKTINFEVPLDSIACTLGDVIAVQHDMAKWGMGGALASGSTKTKVKLDRPVKFEIGTQHVVMIRHDKVVQWTAEIDAILGNTLFLSFGFNARSIDRYRRLIHVPSGKDVAVLEPVIDQFGRHGVLVDSAVGMKIGDTIQLVDTDVIETVNVVMPSDTSVEYTELNLAAPLKIAPREETPWAFGVSENVVGLFSVNAISSGSTDIWRKIIAIEYSDEAYDDEVVEFKPTPVPTVPVLSNVTFRGFQERRYLSGGLYKSEVEFSWEHSSPNYLYGEVHVSIDSEPWRLYEAAASSSKVELSSGNLRVKIVPVNIQGNKPTFDSVATHVKEVLPGAPTQPGAPEDIRAEPRKNLIEIKWGNIDSWAANKNVYRYEVWAAPGENANINDATLLAITGNDHYPHVGLAPDTFYTYWVRAVNILANDKKSGFAPTNGLSVKTLPADTISDLFPGGIGLTDLDDQLQSEVTKESGLEDISAIVSQLAAKVENVTDSNKMEIFQRKEAIAGVEAFVRQEVATLVTEDQAIATMLTELEARVNDDIAAQLRVESQTRANADSALSAQITTLSAQVNDDIAAALREEQIARADADSAIAAQVTSLSAKVNNDIQSAITNEAVARANADTALSGQLTTLTSRVGTAEGKITSESQARANADSALSSRIDTVSSTVGENTTSISQAMTSIDGLKAQYTVKINSNGHVVGFGLATTNSSGGGVASEFSIVADRFKVVKPGTTNTIPVFTVDAAKNRVVIQNAIVGDLQSDNYVAGVSGWIIKK